MLAFPATPENQYTGTKTIHAVALSRGRYNEMRGWQIPADENPEDEGYLVAYPDGHTSWSPKATFEAAYKPSGSFLDRLLIEHTELYERLEKLCAFIGKSPAFEALPSVEQALLCGQQAAMSTYLAMLGMRIDRNR